MVGSGKSGTLNGGFEDCRFVTPQGLCLLRDMIYVADSDSHQIRMVCITWDGDFGKNLCMFIFKVALL